MKSTFDLHAATRVLILKSIDDLTFEQLNYVPNGYDNNIAWNCAHIVCTQQILHYHLCELSSTLSESIIASYRKGTKVEGPIAYEDWTIILKELEQGVHRLKTDYEAACFSTFKKYPTSYGYELNSIEDAIKFNNLHEALHLGYILAMKKVL